jgi:hypothetical protein
MSEWSSSLERDKIFRRETIFAGFDKKMNQKKIGELQIFTENFTFFEILQHTLQVEVQKVMLKAPISQPKGSSEQSN